MTSLRLAQWWWFTHQLLQPKSGLFNRDNAWAQIILIGSSNPSCPVGDNNRPEGLLHHAKSLLDDIWATRWHQGLQITHFSDPDTCKHLFIIPAQTTVHLQSQPRRTERECWETPSAQCVAQGRIFSCCKTGSSSVWAPYVTLVTSHKEWKLLHAWHEAHPCRFLFPLQDFSSDDISGSVWLMRLSRDSL